MTSRIPLIPTRVAIATALIESLMPVAATAPVGYLSVPSAPTKASPNGN